ncbi:hypothetical protein Tco_1335867, partial [Tanacetum coccineum]
SVNLKPVVQTTPRIQDPRVDAFYERAYAIRLAFARSDNCLLIIAVFARSFMQETLDTTDLKWWPWNGWSKKSSTFSEARRAAEKAYDVAKVDERVNKAVAAANRSANAARVAVVKAVQKQRPNKSNGGDLANGDMKN